MITNIVVLEFWYNFVYAMFQVSLKTLHTR